MKLVADGTFNTPNQIKKKSHLPKMAAGCRKKQALLAKKVITTPCLILRGSYLGEDFHGEKFDASGIIYNYIGI